jgi:hypothetical protein
VSIPSMVAHWLTPAFATKGAGPFNPDPPPWTVTTAQFMYISRFPVGARRRSSDQRTSIDRLTRTLSISLFVPSRLDLPLKAWVIPVRHGWGKEGRIERVCARDGLTGMVEPGPPEQGLSGRSRARDRHVDVDRVRHASSHLRVYD